MSEPGFRKRTTALLFGLLLVRFWLGQTFELTGNEAYNWMLSVGHHADWGYWDKGILVPWLIKIGTWFFGDNELGVRWIAAVIYSATGFIIFWCARQWFSPVAAFWSVVLYVVTPIYTWKLLLMDEATASLGLMMLALASYRQAVDTDKWLWWIAAGVVSGLAVHVSWFNAIWPLGLLTYMLAGPVRRHRLAEVKTMLVPAMVAVAAIPIVCWYWRPEAAGLRRLVQVPLVQSSYDFSLANGFEFLGLQAWLLSPGIAVGLLVAFYLAGWVTLSHQRYLLLVLLALPGIIVQVSASFFGAEDPSVMPSLYLPIIFLAGNLWVDFARREKVWAYSGIAILVLALLQSLAGLVPGIGGRMRPGSGLYLPYSYRALADEVTRRRHDAGASFVLAEDAALASLLSFYLPRHEMAYVVHGTGIRSQYDFWVSYDDFANEEAILVMQDDDPPETLRREFTAVEPVADAIPQAEEAGWKLFVCQGYLSGAADGPSEIIRRDPGDLPPLPQPELNGGEGDLPMQ